MKKNIRIGLYFCNCDGKIIKKISYRPVQEKIEQLASIAYIRHSRNLCAFLEGELMYREIVRHRLTGVILVGCSKPAEEVFLRKTLMRAGLDAPCLEMVDILGKLCTIHERYSGMEDKISEMIKLAVAKLENKDVIETVDIPVSRRVLVIGGGLSGIETALELARWGFDVCLCEREGHLGGWLRRINSIAGMKQHPRTFLEEKINCLQKYPSIRVMTNNEPETIRGSLGQFTVRFKGHGPFESEENFGAIVWATGFETKIQENLGGIGIVADGEKKITGIAGLEEMLTGDCSVSGQCYAFILDEDSEKYPMISLLAVKNALFLRQNHQAEVYLFHKNIKVGGDNWEKLYTQAREAGVQFFRYNRLPQWNCQGDKVFLYFDDLYIQGPEDTYMLEADYLVLPDEILLSKEGLNPGEPDNVHYYHGVTSRAGIYLVGSCRYPVLTDDILISVKAVVGDIVRRLSGDILSVRMDQPRVDADKCAVCLTCYRCCPHGAVTIVHDETIGNMYRSAAKMDPLACRRCGICVAECPGKAIQMPGISDAQIFAQIEALQV